MRYTAEEIKALAQDQARPELVDVAHNWRYQAVATVTCHNLLLDQWCGEVLCMQTQVIQDTIHLHGSREEVLHKCRSQVASFTGYAH